MMPQASSIRAEVPGPEGVVEHGLVQRRQDALERVLLAQDDSSFSQSRINNAWNLGRILQRLPALGVFRKVQSTRPVTGPPTEDADRCGGYPNSAIDSTSRTKSACREIDRFL